MRRALALAVVLLAAAVAVAPLAEATLPGTDGAFAGAGSVVQTAAEKAVNPSTFIMADTTQKKD
jgi:long-subunit fatty acid transport protein